MIHTDLNNFGKIIQDVSTHNCRFGSSKPRSMSSPCIAASTRVNRCTILTSFIIHRHSIYFYKCPWASWSSPLNTVHVCHASKFKPKSPPHYTSASAAQAPYPSLPTPATPNIYLQTPKYKASAIAQIRYRFSNPQLLSPWPAI
jgi:hypothetical protein